MTFLGNGFSAKTNNSKPCAKQPDANRTSGGRKQRKDEAGPKIASSFAAVSARAEGGRLSRELYESRKRGGSEGLTIKGESVRVWAVGLGLGGCSALFRFLVCKIPANCPNPTSESSGGPATHQAVPAVSQGPFSSTCPRWTCSFTAPPTQPQLAPPHHSLSRGMAGRVVSPLAFTPSKLPPPYLPCGGRLGWCEWVGSGGRQPWFWVQIPLSHLLAT